MSEAMGDSSEINSFHCKEELSTTIMELNKKRKLRYVLGNLGLPCPKHKFRDRHSSPGHHKLKQLTAREIDDVLEQPETLINDSNISVGFCVNSMTLDVQGGTEKSSSQTPQQDQLSTSSNGSSESALKNSLYSLESISFNKVNNREPTDLEGTSHFEPMQNAIEKQYPDCGAFDVYNHIVSEYEKSGIGDGPEETMLYSNDVAPDSYLHSPGRWILAQDADARSGSRYPTIDQEFEQYFSMLML